MLVPGSDAGFHGLQNLPLPNIYNLDQDEAQWNESCAPFQLHGFTYVDSVKFRLKRNVWSQVAGACHQWRLAQEAGREDLPPCVNTGLYPSVLLRRDKARESLSKCCLGLDTYANLQDDLYSSTGEVEESCLKSEGAFLDFGHIASWTKAATQKLTAQCLLCGTFPCVTEAGRQGRAKRCQGGGPDRNFPPNCQFTPRPMELCTTNTTAIGPENVFWFLWYLQDSSSRAVALKACAEGAYRGKHVTAIPGIVLEQEGQQVAKNFARRYQPLALAVFKMCGVTSAFIHNEFFQTPNHCNPHFIPVDKSVPFPEMPFR